MSRRAEGAEGAAEIFSQTAALRVDEENVERRREPRIECDQPVRVTNLNGGDPVDGRILNLSGRGLLLLLAKPMAINTPVRVDYGENLLLGDVCYCLEGADGFRMGVALAHSLLHNSELSRLASALLRPAESPTRPTQR